MAGEFVALADLLAAPVPLAGAVEAAAAPVIPPAALPREDVDAALRDARHFRARLADAFDDASARLLRELASDVLARELRLAPCDLAAIVRRIGGHAPIVRVRVAPGDAASLAGAPVVDDPELARGDVVVELAGGALDARLGVRLATVLEAFS